MKFYYLLFFVLVGAGCDSPESSESSVQLSAKQLFGQELFNDTNFSLNRTMSCATCHNPNQAFVDTRTNAVNGATSLSADGLSLGDRNTPTIGYSSFAPDFNLNAGMFFGGQFFDGRATNLVEQAKGPFLNSIEMQMPDKASVVTRLLENANYVTSIKTIFGETILDNTDQAYDAIADAIADFESSSVFNPFDSKLDRGELNAQELRGQALFRANRCATCHDDRGGPNAALFTDFSYRNIGVPENTAVRAINSEATDEGLFENTAVTNTNFRGAFKVSSLRNIAVTAPYMHNGVFADLKTVVHFYNTRDVPGALNPETGLVWAAPEVAANVVTIDGMGNLGMTDAEEDDIVAFLKSLTDAKYENLNP